MILAAVAILLPMNTSSAQQAPEPSAIIAIASIDDQLTDIEYLAAATSEQLGVISGAIRFQANGFLPGVEFGKTAGAMLYFVEGQAEPNSIGFLPVKNMDDVLDKLSEIGEIEEEGDLITIIPDELDEFTLKKQGGYVFISEKPELLKNLPADPAALISDQTQKYNLSAQVFPQRIPEELRQQALDLIKQGIEGQLDQMDDLQASLQEAQLKMQMKQMEMWVNEFEQVTIGLDIDKGGERVYLDFDFKAVANSDMAKRLAAVKTTEPSHFGGFLMDGAALTVHNCSGISAEDAKNYVESLQNVRDVMLDEIVEEEDEAKAAVLTKITNRLTEVVKKTLESGVLDMGGAVFTDDGLNASFGAKIADSRGLETVSYTHLTLPTTPYV